MGWNSNFKSANNEDILRVLENVIALDTSVINGDRKDIKPNLLWNGNEFLLIDHSLAFASHKYQNQVIVEYSQKGPLFPESEIMAHCTFNNVHRRHRKFRDLFDSWKSIVTTQNLSAIRSLLPKSWETNAGELDRIFWFLENRLTLENVELLLRRVVQ